LKQSLIRLSMTATITRPKLDEFKENKMTIKIEKTVEVKQVKTGNFGPLFDREDITKADLKGGEQPEMEKQVGSDLPESKEDETVAPLEAPPNPPFKDRWCD